ncbi:cytochrome P450 [Rudaeicoccus suwonensis]|uniref:Cytochrome P450 n=1 Tax=Rudaeicoccus suwonensis TaxID=657409 RepID=A0A561E3R9_9MICO|nr:cytochrome P450 [Rudaeicoccus suwonensis]TWE10231.1 cytochrome P450 [Rudaeicoccus suwonensis]
MTTYDDRPATRHTARWPSTTFDATTKWAREAVHWGALHGVPRVGMRMAARKGDTQGQLILAAASDREDEVWTLIEQARSEGRVIKGQFAYLTTDHDAVREVLSSNDFQTGTPAASRSRLTRLIEWSSSGLLHPVEAPSLLVSEPPDHTRYRKLVTRVFTARAVMNLRERTQQIADDLLDSLDPTRPVDLVESYCGLLPVTVISQILGVPQSEQARVLQMGTAAAASLDMGVSWHRFRDVNDALAEFDVWLTEHIGHLRQHPGDDLMSQLVQARDEQGALSDQELKATAGLVLAAGFETTVNLLGNGIALLDRHPDQLQVLREDPDLWPNAVDEVLRLDPPVLLTGRACVRDTTVVGVPIAAGSFVTTVLAGANRDPKVFTGPARFDVTRENARDHIAFSAGRHFCLGAALARMEGEVGLRSLFDRFPSMRVLPGARRRDTRVLRGFASLPTQLG